jgi:hypothetical protein
MCRLPIQRTGLVDAPFWRHHEGWDRQLDATELLKSMAYHACPPQAGTRLLCYIIPVIVAAPDAHAGSMLRQQEPTLARRDARQRHPVLARRKHRPLVRQGNR